MIDSYAAKRTNFFVWYRELGKGLTAYCSRPELILEVFNQLLRSYNYYSLETTTRFADSLSNAQILELIKTKSGSFLLNTIFNRLINDITNPTIPLTADERNNLTRLAMKVDSVRNPFVTNDARPYIGEMVENNDGLQYKRNDDNLDSFWLLDQGDYRFGVGHDGEHIMGNRNGSRVKGFAGLIGLILTYYKQLPDANYAVFILLNDSKTVLVLKDLINLSPSVLKAPNSTNNGAIPKFIDKAGQPISKLKIGVGETIGFTAKWSGAANESAVGMHFTILKYQFAQQFRDLLPKINGLLDTDIGTKSISKAYQQWLVVPCSSESPVRCR